MKSKEERTRVVETFGDMVWRLALAYTADVPNAEDVFQEVFCRYFRHEDRFESDEHRKAWLIRCTINRAKSVLSSPFRRRTLPLEAAAELAAGVGVSEEHRAVYAAVMALPKKYRFVIHAYYYEGWSVEEIAGYLSCPQGTVKSQLSRGRALLKKEMR